MGRMTMRSAARTRPLAWPRVPIVRWVPKAPTVPTVPTAPTPSRRAETHRASTTTDWKCAGDGHYQCQCRDSESLRTRTATPATPTPAVSSPTERDWRPARVARATATWRRRNAAERRARRSHRRRHWQCRTKTGAMAAAIASWCPVPRTVATMTTTTPMQTTKKTRTRWHCLRLLRQTCRESLRMAAECANRPTHGPASWSATEVASTTTTEEAPAAAIAAAIAAAVVERACVLRETCVHPRHRVAGAGRRQRDWRWRWRWPLLTATSS